MRDTKITVRNNVMWIDLVYHWPLPSWRTLVEELAYQVTRVAVSDTSDFTVTLNGQPMASAGQLLDTLYPSRGFEPEWKEDRSWNQ